MKKIILFCIVISTFLSLSIAQKPKKTREWVKKESAEGGKTSYECIEPGKNCVVSR